MASINRKKKANRRKGLIPPKTKKSAVVMFDRNEIEANLNRMFVEDVIMSGKPSYAYNFVHGAQLFNTIDRKVNFETEISRLNSRQVFQSNAKDISITIAGKNFDGKLLVFQKQLPDGSWATPNNFVGIDPIGFLYGSLVPGYHYLVFE